MPTAVSMAGSMSILALVSASIGTAMPTAVSMAGLMSILALVSVSIGTAMPMAVSMAGSMSILALVGDGASESVDPDPIVPTVGAN
jgi:hypothetical protein